MDANTFPQHPLPQKDVKHPAAWLVLLCLFQIVFWTLGPWLTRHTMMSDTLEGIVWGNLWQWGYDKHPPFAPWLTAVFANLGDQPDLPVYLLAQLCVVVVFLAVWRLAREYLSDSGALLSVFLLLGILFYSNRVERVTPDTVQAPLWALLALSFYFAVTRRSTKHWLICGVLAGLAALTKYQAAVLFLSLFVSLLITEEGRCSLKSSGPWLAGILALLIVSPHILWLYSNDFVAVSYVESTYVNTTEKGSDSWRNHLIEPAEFAINNLSNVLLTLLLFLPFYRTFSRKEPSPVSHSQFQRVFLVAIATGPFLLTLLVGLISGEKLIPRWATPYFAWLPLLLLVFFKPEISRQQFRTSVAWCLITAVTLFSLRISYLYFQPLFNDNYKDADEFHPAREEMQQAEELWRHHFDYPMPYLGGSHYHVVELLAYSHGDTIPFLGLNPGESRWMKEEDFRVKGGMIVTRDGQRASGKIRQRLKNHYPEAIFLGTYKFKPQIKIEMDEIRWRETHYYLLKPEE